MDGDCFSVRSLGEDEREILEQEGNPIKNWEYNLDQMSIWFPEMDFEWGSEGAKYVFSLSGNWSVTVSCGVDADTWNQCQDIRGTIWIIDIAKIEYNEETDEYSESEELCFLYSMDSVSEFQEWAKEKGSFYPQIREQLQTLAIAVDLLWKAVIEANIKDHGLFLGCWLGGAVINLEERGKRLWDF